MSRRLKVTIGQHSDKGRKDVNQDFHGALVPGEPLLSTKGVAIALADGISSSNVSGIASESAVKSFLTDYYCTSESWSVKTSAHRVIAATNSWLHAETRRSQYSYERDKGYVCTLSAIVVKATTAHLFHVGDSRIWRVAGQALEQLTADHRVVVSSEQSYLSRALGVNHQIEIDYQAVPVEAGDVLLLTTDGVHEYVSDRVIIDVIREHNDDLDAAARAIAGKAFDKGSPDNLTVQIVRIDDVPAGEAPDLLGRATELPVPPLLEARSILDGYRIVREIHGSSRSHIYLAVEIETGAQVTIKIPSIDLRDDPEYLKRFMMEEWVAQRIDSPHVLKPRPPSHRRSHLYVVNEFIEGQTLTQWMIDHPKPDLETVRGIAEQIAAGLRAFHRKEMLHQDLRPENIMIDKTGTAKIIDFGSTWVSGVAEASPVDGRGDVLGTHQYTAPEYFIGEGGSSRSDLYSLGVITYQMLTGSLPYGARMAQARTQAQQMKVRYRSALEDNRNVPAWVDAVLWRAVHADPAQRQEVLSEFLHDLRHPKESYRDGAFKPLMERNPLVFWKSVAIFFACATALLLLGRLSGRF